MLKGTSMPLEASLSYNLNGFLGWNFFVFIPLQKAYSVNELLAKNCVDSNNNERYTKEVTHVIDKKSPIIRKITRAQHRRNVYSENWEVSPMK